ncbi:GNAT family N-acetyltransferase [Cellulomonas bogoriensis]|uniref:Acetyltransferase n=1 Tax=Cellulomonas bogoriensis 69B4 = DSM 16987 TaxID=1386082 RepID=A0A0A0C1M3_9CELL|nr:GNAT family N-acetyltransferase [Cellulomonas bogoriensis]KGM13244.1 acetyltransferase [Cellulomonas bogoriensis 69B4 = DSM 16987]
MDVTELTDAVVRLAPPGRQDEQRVLQLCQDPDIQRWTVVPSPYRLEDARAFVGELVPRWWAEGTACTWGIHHDGELVGMIGLHTQPARSAEVGYWLGAAHRGRGLLHRSLGLVLDHAFGPLDLDRVEWRAYAGNWASWRVAWRQGFRFEGAIRGAGLQRGHRRDDWIGTLLRGDPREARQPWPATTIDVPDPAPRPAPKESP